MATINLGSIKFNWRGAYNNATAYAVDDVVSSGGSSYICILASTGNAVSNGTYWQVMAEGGDVATTLTTQGDILYRDGSGLQRLAAGISGQALLTGGSGANPSWGTVGGASNAFMAHTKSNATSGDVVYTTELFDDGGNYNNTNGRYTAPSAGKYLFIAGLYVSGNHSTDMYFKKNGTAVNGGTDRFGYGNNTNFSTSFNLIIDLATSDYVNVSSTNNTYSNYNFFGGVKLY